MWAVADHSVGGEVYNHCAWAWVYVLQILLWQTLLPLSLRKFQKAKRDEDRRVLGEINIQLRTEVSHWARSSENLLARTGF